MPTIEVSHKDLCALIGKNIDVRKLENEDLLYAKCEADGIVNDTIKLDVKDTNRPDLWSVEGVAREIRYRYKPNFPNYKTKKSNVVVRVDKNLKDVRPLTVCAVVRGLKINTNVLSQMIQLQEKIVTTFGKNRKEVAIGVYDMHKIRSPIKYTTVGRTEIKFVPLDFERELTPQEIIEKHPKGKEFGHLLKDAARIPAFIDSENNVLSIPPIINSAHTGKVTEQTNDVFIECSGFDMKLLKTALNVMVTALHERNGKIETVDVMYDNGKIITPDLSPKKFSVSLDYINKLSGLGLGNREIIKVLDMSGYKAKGGSKINLLYPAYRQDIMHARDVLEDVIITYGFNNVKINQKKFATSGKLAEKEIFLSNVSDILIGLGLQEVLSYTLTNKREIFENMNISHEPIAEIDNPQSANWSVFRNWLLPSLMEFLAKNKHIEYPQKVFEIGECVKLDEKQETRSKDTTKIAAAISNSIVNYDDVSSILHSIMKNIGVAYKLKSRNHGSFIPGRCAEIIIGDKSVGVMGEVHPVVLNNWNLEKPVVAFEINLGDIYDMKRK